MSHNIKKLTLSKNRYRDYTPDKIEFHAVTGGANHFTKFLKDELFEFINKKFRVQPFRIIFGHSYGGTYVFNLLLKKPELFGGYIVASPNLFILRNLENKIKNFLRNNAYKNKSLFMTVGE